MIHLFILTIFYLLALTSAQNSSSSSVSPDYTITALPVVTSAPTCIFNCLIPIGLADPSGCDDVTNDCACLSAPVDVLDFLTGCVKTVCKSSTSAYEISATSLYLSYCSSIYGAVSISSALSANSAADAAAAASTSMAGMSMSSETTSTGVATSSSAAASATAKSGSSALEPFLLASYVYTFGGILVLVLL